MARPIKEIAFSELEPTLRILAEKGMTTADADWIRSGSGENAIVFMSALREAQGKGDKNPFELSVEGQLDRLRLAINEEGWDIGAEVLDQLAKTAPEWPKGRLAFRGIRIRFGTGSEGVAQTFEAHVARIKRVFGAKKFWRWDYLLSRVESTPFS